MIKTELKLQKWGFDSPTDYKVRDNVSSGAFPDDIDNQGTFDNSTYWLNYKNNYAYDELGNLKKDSAEGIQSIEWTVYGKIKKVTRYSSSTKPDLEFIYDPSGNRICKIVKPKTITCATNKYFYYLRDAQGNEMANYELNMVSSCSTVNKLYVTDHQMYGSSRLGMDSRRTLLYDSGVNLSNDTLKYTHRELGKKQFELSNHLGNVLVTVTDKRIPKSISGTDVDYFDPDIKTISDYFAFGSPMPHRGDIESCTSSLDTTITSTDVINENFASSIGGFRVVLGTTKSNAGGELNISSSGGAPYTDTTFTMVAGKVYTLSTKFASRSNMGASVLCQIIVSGGTIASTSFTALGTTYSFNFTGTINGTATLKYTYVLPLFPPPIAPYAFSRKESTRQNSLHKTTH